MPPGLSSGMTLKRINREIADLKKEDLGGMSLEPDESNLFHWKASIPGPEGSPYEGGVFNLNVELCEDYPFSAPKVTFATRIYHMNISDRGHVCIDVLKQNWSPALSLYKVLLSLSSLLTDPNPKDPLVTPIANEYLRNRQKHDNTAREWTRLYAQPPKPKTQSKGKGKVTASEIIVVEGTLNGRAQTTQRNGRSQRTIPAVTVNLDDGVIDLTSASENTSTRSRAGTKRKRAAAGAGEGAEDAVGTSSRRRRTANAAPASDVIEIED